MLAEPGATLTRALRLSLLALGALASIATSPAEYGDEASLNVGNVVLDAENPTFDIDAIAHLDGAEGTLSTWIILEGTNAATESSELVLVDRASGAELDRLVIAGGFADDPAEVRVSFSLEWEPTEPLAVQIVLEGAGPIAADVTLEASFFTHAQPEDEITLELEPT
jgi:hypothetical protein